MSSLFSTRKVVPTLSTTACTISESRCCQLYIFSLLCTTHSRDFLISWLPWQPSPTHHVTRRNLFFTMHNTFPSHGYHGNHHIFSLLCTILSHLMVTMATITSFLYYAQLTQGTFPSHGYHGNHNRWVMVAMVTMRWESPLSELCIVKKR